MTRPSTPFGTPRHAGYNHPSKERREEGGHGSYVNPGNEGFAGIVADEYVDKTELISLF